MRTLFEKQLYRYVTKPENQDSGGHGVNPDPGCDAGHAMACALHARIPVTMNDDCLVIRYRAQEPEKIPADRSPDCIGRTMRSLQ
ncbi:hypothetical protein [Methanoregula sp.]